MTARDITPETTAGPGDPQGPGLRERNDGLRKSLGLYAEDRHCEYCEKGVSSGAAARSALFAKPSDEGSVQDLQAEGDNLRETLALYAEDAGCEYCDALISSGADARAALSGTGQE